MSNEILLTLLERVAQALERLSPPPCNLSLEKAESFIWHSSPEWLEPIPKIKAVPLTSLLGIDSQKSILYDNIFRFSKGYSANNALLWGARGTGKSSLVKAIHQEINHQRPDSLILIEIHREELKSLERLLTILRSTNKRILLFCDDLSFEHSDDHYKSLKALLDGGIAGKPDHLILYATSNRRHLMPREMIENSKNSELIPGEEIEEKVSLSDRFGLWIGFHNLNQETYFAIIEGYIRLYNLNISSSQWKKEAIEWSATRGSRSGRVAWQFIQDIAGRLGRSL